MEKDEKGNVVRLHCTYDPETRGGNSPNGRKVKGTIHWVSAEHAVNVEVRLYDRLFTKEEPEVEGDFLDYINQDSLKVITAKAEPLLKEIAVDQQVQFERLGYFTPDIVDTSVDKPVFNRIVSLRDSWAKIAKK